MKYLTKKMKVKNLILKLKTLDPEKDIYVSSDEELNTVYGKFEICEIALDYPEGKDTKYVIFGLSTTELDI